jgi:WD40 repeat protein
VWFGEAVDDSSNPPGAPESIASTAKSPSLSRFERELGWRRFIIWACATLILTGALTAALFWKHRKSFIPKPAFALERTLTGGQGCLGVEFSPDSSLLASQSFVGIRLWELTTGKLLARVDQVAGVVWPRWDSFSFSHNGEELLSVRFELVPTNKSLGGPPWTGKSVLTIWKIQEEGKLSLLDKVPLPDQGMLGVWGTRLASSSPDGTITVWDDLRSAGSGKKLRGDNAPIDTLAFGPTPLFLASGSHDGQLKVWGIYEDNPPRSFEGHKAGIWNVVFNRDGDRLASTGDDAAIIWNVETGAKVCTLNGRGQLKMAFSPDGKILATGYYAVSLWDAATCQYLDTLGDSKRTDETTCSLSFSPDGQWLGIGGDERIQLWRRSH